MREKILMQELIGRIDARINRQVNSILHHPVFQRLESSWRGLALLASTSTLHKQLRLRMLDVDYLTLNQDIVNSTEIEYSQLFKKIYTEELDQPGGQPFGLLIGDYYVANKTIAGARDGVEFLRQMAKIAAASFAPFVTAIDAAFFGLNSFAELQAPYKLTDLFASADYQRWQQLRQDQQAHFVALTLPRVLMRTPYNDIGIRMRHRFFKERLTEHDDYLWGNSSYIYAQTVMQSFAESGWFSKIRGNVLPASVQMARHYYGGQKLIPKFVTEYFISDKHEHLLNNAGFIALRDHRLAEKTVFYSSQTLKYPSQNSAAKINTLLHNVLCASRFAHYIKIIIRDKIGKFISAEECETNLSRWLNNYCSASQTASAAALARQPLSAASVSVSALPGSSGQYFCEMLISPHTQFDDIHSQLRLLTQVKLT